MSEGFTPPEAQAEGLQNEVEAKEENIAALQDLSKLLERNPTNKQLEEIFKE